MKFITILFVIITFSTLVNAQDKNEVKKLLDSAIATYYKNDLQNSKIEFEKVIKADSVNIEALNYYAEICRRLEIFEQCQVSALKVLKLSECNSFALSTLGNLFSPQYSSWKKVNFDSTWGYCLKAVDCDDKECEAWMSIYIESLRRGERELEIRAMQKLYDANFFSEQILACNRITLKSLPPNSILITNGDGDTYPAIALQITEKIRPDVIICNYNLLNMYWYARLMSERINAGLPFTYEEARKVRAHFLADSVTEVYLGYDIVEHWKKLKTKNEFIKPLAFSFGIPYKLFLSDNKYNLLPTAYVYEPSFEDNEADTAGYETAMHYISGSQFKGEMASKLDRSPIRSGVDKYALRAEIINSYIYLIHTYMYYANLLSDNSLMIKAKKAARWILQFAEDSDAGTELKNSIINLGIIN